MRASLLAITFATACGSSSTDKPPPAADTSVKLVGVSGQRTTSITCSGTLASGSYGVTVAGIAFKLVAPAGAKLTLGSATLEPGATATVDPLAFAADIHSGDSFDIPVHLTLADGSSPRATLTCSSSAIGVVLKRIGKAGIQWKPADDVANDLAVVVHPDGRTSYVGASTKSLASADLVAFEPARPAPTSPNCKLEAFDLRTNKHLTRKAPCADPARLLHDELPTPDDIAVRGKALELDGVEIVALDFTDTEHLLRDDTGISITGAPHDDAVWLIDKLSHVNFTRADIAKVLHERGYEAVDRPTSTPPTRHEDVTVEAVGKDKKTITVRAVSLVGFDGARMVRDEDRLVLVYAGKDEARATDILGHLLETPPPTPVVKP